MNGVDLRVVANQFKDKLSLIKVFLTDVDGVLTDGKIFYSGDEIGFNRFFHAHDGYGLKMLQAAGIKVGFVTGGNSESVFKRAENLQIDLLFYGDEDKRHAYDRVKADLGVKDEEILYIGDEFFDLPLLERAGFSVTTPQASMEIKEAVDYVTIKNGGEGAVREVVDMIRYVQGIVPNIPR